MTPPPVTPASSLREPLPIVRAPSATLDHVQYLRGVAATMVVFHHCMVHQGAISPAMEFGARGVDVFFVISGFIMSISIAGRRLSAGDFFSRRLIRIVPLYWIALALIVRKDIVVGSVSLNLAMDFAFLPHYSPGYPGRIYPALVPGWSLNYEMFFYGLLASTIALTTRPLVAVSLMLGTLVIAGIALPSDIAFAKFYTSPLLLLFVYGIGVAEIFARAKPKSPTVLWLVLVGALVVICLPIDAPRALAVGVPAAVAVYAAACLSSVSHWRSKTLALVGDASYSIYLFHGYGVSTGQKLFGLSGIDPAASVLGQVAGTTVLCTLGIAVGCIVYRVLEVPLLASGRALWQRATRS